MQEDVKTFPKKVNRIRAKCHKLRRNLIKILRLADRPRSYNMNCVKVDLHKQNHLVLGRAVMAVQNTRELQVAQVSFCA